MTGAQVLILYDPFTTHVNTVVEHLASFGSFSENRFFYMPAVQDRICRLEMSRYDALVLHYSIRLSVRNHLSRSFAEKIRNYKGLKILFIQDEYENTALAMDCMEYLGFDIVYTCIPESYVEKVYPKDRFANVLFKQTLTGFVPAEFENQPTGKPIKERELLIGYRGRQLGYWYGKLGQEKIEIGRRMRAICSERGLPTNIEWTEERRIYRKDWYAFLGNCKATLGTESGANMFDFDGELKSRTLAYLRRNPSASFEEVFEKFLKPYDDLVPMGQISPKHFEAIALRTALVLFEGKYSGILEPWRHYIPLKKDFSNVEEVLAKLQDDSYLSDLTERAYLEIIQSGRFSYRAFVREFDDMLNGNLKARTAWRPILTVAGWRDLSSEHGTHGGLDRATAVESGLPDAPTFREPYLASYDHRPVQLTVLGVTLPACLRRFLETIWERTPGFVRRPVRSVLLRIYGK